MKNYDEILNINTSVVDEWAGDMVRLGSHYFRSEPTDYHSIELLFESYQPKKDSSLVDIGCGQGRVLFYANYFFDIRVSGVEYNEAVFKSLEENVINYKEKHPKKPEIDLHYIQAENYQIQSDQNIIYLFNPFSTAIFKKFINNVYLSLIEFPRVLDLILYYPNDEWVNHLGQDYFFDIYQLIKLEEYQRDPRECFVIYRHTPYQEVFKKTAGN